MSHHGRTTSRSLLYHIIPFHPFIFNNRSLARLIQFKVWPSSLSYPFLQLIEITSTEAAPMNTDKIVEECPASVRPSSHSTISVEYKMEIPVKRLT